MRKHYFKYKIYPEPPLDWKGVDSENRRGLYLIFGIKGLFFKSGQLPSKKFAFNLSYNLYIIADYGILYT